MTAGNSPALRSFRALPVPIVLRGFALSEKVGIQISLLERTCHRRSTCRLGAYSQVAAPTLPSVATRSGSPSGHYFLLEQAADRLLGVGVANRFGNQLTNRKDGQLWWPTVFRNLD